MTARVAMEGGGQRREYDLDDVAHSAVNLIAAALVAGESGLPGDDAGPMRITVLTAGDGRTGTAALNLRDGRVVRADWRGGDFAADLAAALVRARETRIAAGSTWQRADKEAGR